MALYMEANLSYKNYIGAFGGLTALPILIWQIKSLDISDAENCLLRFKSNVYLGFIMAVAMLFGCIIY